MSRSIEGSSVLRHCPLVVVFCTLLVAALTRSEGLRGTAAVVSIFLVCYELVIYRRTASGVGWLLQSLIATALGTASLWLGLNVVRYYTYDPESARIWALHGLVARIQDFLLWAAAAVAIFILISAALQLARWLTKKLSIPS